MKHCRTLFLAMSAVLSVSACSAQEPKPATKIILTAENVINETGFGDAEKLVDEQEKVGDPASGKGNEPTSPFFPGWTDWQYPVSVLIDLGAKHRVTQVYLYNNTGMNEATLSYGAPFQWKANLPVKLDGYKAWKMTEINAETRYLRVTVNKPVSLPEIVVYGTPLAKPHERTGRIMKHRTTIDQMIGTNAFIDDPIDKIAVGGYVREYHPWAWDVENKDGLRRFNPSAAAGGNAWFFDDYYAKLKAAGCLVVPALMGSITQVTPGINDDASKPVPPGQNSEDPASYKAHAAHLFQYAARYGNSKVPDELLDLAPGQPRVSALNLLRYLENWNEQDKTWKGRAGYFTPYETAAMSSADYDGHQGKLGRAYGIKQADPTMRLSLGGLAVLNLDYIRAIKVWADANRDGSFPADVINLHHYSSDGVEQNFGKTGISPEADKLRERMARFTDWRDLNLPVTEIWLTEFGYDTNPGSPIHAPAIGSLSAEQVQGAWIVRSYLALSAAGIDRAAQFMLRDVDSAAPGVFATSGFVTEKGKWEPKPSWFYTSTLSRRLAGMLFDAEVPSGNPAVMVYRFKDTKGTKVAYAVWCPTSEDKHVKGFALPAKSKNATVITLVDKQAEGTAKEAKPQNDTLTLDVSEIPTLVVLP